MKIAALICMATVIGSALAAYAGEMQCPRSSVLLNGVWKFAPAPDGNIPADGWTPVRVPHRSREFENEPPTSAWYATEFTVPEAWAARDAEIILDLSRVRHYGRVYLGEQGTEPKVIGEHWGMRTPWRIKLTDIVRPSGTYSLTIYAHNCTGKYVHPSGKEFSEAGARALDSLFWYTGAATVGVEGDVWLRLEPKLRVDDIYMVTRLHGDDGKKGKQISAEVTVRNDSDRAVTGRVAMNVVRDGKTELQFPPQDVKLEPNSSQVVRSAKSWDDAVLWGRPPFGKPVLYFLRAELVLLSPLTPPQDIKITVADVQFARFGFREILAEGDKLLLNDRPLFTWGDHSIPYVHERQFLTRKLPDLAASGVSIIENHRYDAPPVLYDVADELGMFVIASNFCVGSSQVPTGLKPDEQQLIVGDHCTVAETQVRRDRNHPSILFWDITDTWAPEYAVPLMKAVKGLDRSRLVEVTYNDAPPEVLELIDVYRLFAGLPQIEASIKKIRESGLPVKPIRVGEAGIFAKGSWGYDEQPPMLPGWLNFIKTLPGRNIHGLQTFFLTDMDYRGFTFQVPGMLSQPLNPKITWPSQSGADARVDPFGEGTQQAWGKAAVYVNWCDPTLPVSKPTALRAWWKNMFHELAGEDVGPLSKTRVPEVIITVLAAPGKPVPGAMVFVSPLENQAVVPYGVKADADGNAWFVLPEEGRYRFTAGKASVEVKCKRTKIDVKPGYEHVQRVNIEQFK